ncbi:MAG TPA: flagellar basal-body MS-ring/collar protein FliF [Rhizomicrobium sp.]|nr:flagellar basal-body MS-ring/collar protein FliF [Rhizomicrobium sp.]
MELIRNIGAARFGVMAGVAAALTAFFLYVAGVVSEPPMTILYAGLEPRDAAAVTAKLDAMSVKYEAKGDGGTILVPNDQVTKLRMELASEHLPSAGVGYEIFDKSDSFGTTAFVQNINQLRALEGELARSIQTIDGIDEARVHLVIPERQIFARDAQSPSASVILRTRVSMGHGQVAAIQHLVAAAVAGLDPARVAIVDDRGDLLAGGEEKTGVDAVLDNQENQTTDFEERLRQRVENIVTSVVGPGHVRVQVAADMKYDHINETQESFDPDSKVIRSTQTVEQNASDSNGKDNNAVSVQSALPGGQQANQNNGSQTKSNSDRTEETTNYEISKTVRTSQTDGGDLKRLSVAVVVDGETTTDAAGKDSYRPRTAKEMQQIEALVKSAIGFNQQRGDQVQVTNMEFARIDAGQAVGAPPPFLGLDSGDWFKIIEAGILSLTALLIGLLVVRPLINRMFAPLSNLSLAPPQPGQPAIAGELPAPAKPGEPTPAAISAPKESMIDISRIEGQVRESSIRKVGEVVEAHPEEALAIIRTWLHQPV